MPPGRLHMLVLALLLITCRLQLVIAACIPASANVLENTPNGTLIAPITPVAPTGFTPTISYATSNQFNCYFYVNGTGVHMNRVVDLELPTSCAPGGGNISDMSLVQLTVQCSPSESGILIVLFSPVDEFKPFFLSSLYSFNLSEATAIGTIVVTLRGQVDDKDVRDVSDFNFAIESTISGVTSFFTMEDGRTSGILRVNRTLDYDAGPDYRQFRLNISATPLTPVPDRVAYTVVQISIIDFDDLSPEFSQDTYRLAFVENDTSFINTSLPTTPKLWARDMDFGINQTVQYKIQSGASLSGQPFLTINKSTGEFSVIRIIDREALTSNEILLQVKAYQTDKPDTRIALATVIVTVLDKNDNRPVISPPALNTSIAENSAAGTYVTRLTASDLDLNSTVEFGLVDATGAFQLDAGSGVVTVRNSSLLDREAVPSFSFIVYAEELYTAARYRSDNASVLVALTDVNDNSPQFTLAQYNFSVSEAAPIGTLVGQVSATDTDAGPNGQVKFSLTHASGNGLSVMSLNLATGALTLSANLSTANPTFVASYQLVATATDQAVETKDRRVASAIVQVSVNSSRLWPPVFTRPVFAVNVTEASPTGAEVVRLTATYRDPDTVLTYSILSGIGSDKFTVVNSGNEGLVRVAATLDRETVDFYNLTAIVSDGLKTATTQVQIRLLDYNDNAPRFNRSSFNFTVVENLPPPASVGRVLAADADEPGTVNSVLQFSLLGAQAAAYFNINASSGEIFTKGAIDREAVGSFSFPVLVSDGGTPQLSASADVLVQVLDVNDNAPDFDPAMATAVSLPEKSLYAGFLQLKFTDPDTDPNRESRFALLPPSDLSGVFVLNSSTGFLSSTAVLTRAVFGNSTKHNLTVMVYNVQPLVGPGASVANRTRVVTVTLLDTNDNRPLFVQSLFPATVPEDLPVGREVAKVTANDKDTVAPYSTVVYNITGGNELGKFRLDSRTGSLTLWLALNYDAPDYNRNFSIQVMAYNPVLDPATGSVLNDTAQVWVTVTDVNDNAPVFLQDSYEFVINETLPVGSHLGAALRAYDNDSSFDTADIAYEIRPSVGLPFSVANNTTGDLMVTASISRDDGGPAVYAFQAAAVNRRASPQLSAVASVTVRVLGVNNNSPVFASGLGGYNFSVAENLPMRTTVGAVAATDRDGDALVYSVLGTDLFSVQSGGLLVTLASIDRESLLANPVAFVVQSNDSLHVTNVSVRVEVSDVNDNAPRLVPPGAELSVSVMEAAPNGTLVTQLNATDPDAGQNANVTFSFLTGGGALFLIDALTGRVTVANGNELDYQKQQEHMLIVAAADHGSPAQSSFQTLRVRIIDMNDKPVTFSPSAYSAMVLESLPPGQLAVRVFASDPDTVPASGFNFSLANPTEDAATFYLTDAVSTKSASLMVGATLDREARDFYSVRLHVTDGRFVDTSAVVNVTVGDVNDNAPRFAASDYVFFADELAPVGAIVGRVAATDADAGVNAQLVFFLAGGEENFRLDFRTGELSLALARLNASLKSVHRLLVTARDQGSPSLSAAANVTVYVNATNAHAPVFNPAVYTVAFNETTPAGVVIVTVLATDADYPSANGRVTYSLMPPADAHFEIDSVSGAIRLKLALDFETAQTHALVAVATDSGAMARSATAPVFVAVLNADDTPPRFRPLEYSFLAPANAMTGWQFGFVSAVDPDFPTVRPQPIIFSVAPGNGSVRVDSATGSLSLAGAAPTPGNHSATVTATDSAGLTTSAPVLLTILPNDVYYAKVPVLPASPLIAPVLLENQTNFLTAADISARINAGAADAGVLYRLAAGGDKFSISADAGILTAHPHTLDRETASEESAVAIAINAAEPAYSASVLISIPLNDINDNAPLFQFPSGDCLVSENATVNTVVATALAVDPDVTTGAPTYTLIADSSAGKFRIQAGSGNTVQVLVNSPLDYDTMAAVTYRYSLTIRASDGTFASNYTLIVRIGDVNDNPPTFAASSYNFVVAEQSAASTVIGRVSATDLDTADGGGDSGGPLRLIYRLGPPAGSGAGFTIDSGSGVISTAVVFDRLLISRVTFNVTCEDTAGQTAIALVSVDITDVNNHAPTPPKPFYTRTQAFKIYS